MSFLTVDGISVPRSDCLREEYELRPRRDDLDHVICNVSAERLGTVFEVFVARMRFPGFLVLEVPCNEAREIELRGDDTTRRHREVYYLDGLEPDTLEAILRPDLDLLIHDGLTHFGYGANGSRDEIFVGAYKILHLFAGDWTRFRDVFAAFAIPATARITTAWDTFTPEHPGARRRLERNGRDVYDLVEDLMRGHGLYLARTIPD
jgi:hypothetical protein